MNDNQITEEIHIGKLLKAYIDSNRIYKSALARKLKRNDSTILDYQKNNNLSTLVLQQLSHALQHNFFQDIAALLPTSYSTNAPVDTKDKDEITALQLEITILKAEKAVLLQALSGKE
ncbi:MAG: hypothetical protein V4548_10405 [Bacteroidota bacterium]